jgi:integrase
MEFKRMPRPFRVPAYQLHRGTGQARVRIAGRDHYLGPHGSELSRQRYEQIVRKLLTNREKAELARRAEFSSSLAIGELVSRYLRHARTYYVKNGRPTNEYGNIASALGPLLERHGLELVTSFGPKALKAIREDWEATKLVRSSINKRVERVRRCFAWGVAEELVPIEVLAALRTVKGLSKGRTQAPEGRPVRLVPDAFVDALQAHVSRQVWAMVELQRLTGARPGEITIMRTCDLVTSGRIWEYKPSSHKSEHRGKDRVIFLGPRAQEVLRPWLRTDLESFLFQPREAMVELWAQRRTARKTKMTPSQAARTRVKRPGKTPRDRYTTTSYSRAIREGIKKANRGRKPDEQIPHWSVHQLRHSAATRLRREFGLDVARAVLGHSSPAVTELYAELDHAKAAAAMEQIG